MANEDDIKITNSVLSFSDENKVVFAIFGDGHIELGEEIEPDQVSQIFWNAIKLNEPKQIIDRLEARICELETKLGYKKTKADEKTNRFKEVIKEIEEK